MSVPTPSNPELEALLTRVRGPVERFIGRVLHNEWQREEALQETWMALIQSPQQALKAKNPVAWALRIAYRKSVDELRHQKKSEAVSDVSQLSDPSSRNEKMRELREWFLLAMEKLRPDQRALLHLRYDQGMNSKEIAKILERRAGTIRRWLAEAQRELGAALDHTSAGHRVPWAVAFLPLLSSQAKSMEAAVLAASLPAASAPIGIAFSSSSGVLAMKKFAVVALAVLALGGLSWWASDALMSSESSDQNEDLAEATTGAADALDGQQPSAEIVEPQDPEKSIETNSFSGSSSAMSALQGRVEDEHGSPIIGAEVFAMPRQIDARPQSFESAKAQYPDWTAISGPRGAFVIKRPRIDLSRRVMVVARCEGFAPEIRYDITFGSTQNVLIVLRRGRSLSGRVETLQGAPIASARVEFRGILGRGRLSHEVTTNADGHWHLQSLPHADSLLLKVEHLSVSHPGFAPQRKAIPPGAWSTAGEDGEGTPLTIKLARGAMVKGSVVKAEDGTALAGVDVALWTFGDFMGAKYARGMMFTNPFGSRILAKTKTDAHGNYEFRNVPVKIADIKVLGTTKTRLPSNGMWHLGGVVACAEGYAQSSDGVGLPTEEGSTQVIDLRLSPAASIRGRVTDQNGEPVAGVRVRANTPTKQRKVSPYPVPGEGVPFGAWAESDRDGRYRIDGLPVAMTQTQATELLVSGCGCHVGLAKTGVQSVTLRRGSTTDVPDLLLDVSTLRGVVRDAFGDPVCGAEVMVDQGLAVLSDAQGRWSRLVPSQPPPLGDSTKAAQGANGSTMIVPPKRCRVRIRKAGYALVDERTSGQSSPHLTTLVKEKTLSGRILLSDGTPLANHGFTMQRRRGGEPETTNFESVPVGRQTLRTNDSGQFFVNGLTAAPCFVAVTHRRTSSQFQVTPGDHNLVLRLPESEALFAVHLRLLRPDGSPFLGEVTSRILLKSRAGADENGQQKTRSLVGLNTNGLTFMGKGADSDGVIRIPDLKKHEGPITVDVSPKGYPTQTIKDLQFESPVTKRDLTIDIGFTLNVRVALPPKIIGASVRVTAQSVSTGRLRRVTQKCNAAGEASLAGLTSGSWTITAQHHSVRATWISTGCKVLEVPEGHGSLPEERLSLTKGVTQFLRLKLTRAPKSSLELNDPVEVTIEDHQGGVRRQSIVSVEKLMKRYSTSIQLPSHRGLIKLKGPRNLLLEFPFDEPNAELKGEF